MFAFSFIIYNISKLKWSVSFGIFFLFQTFYLITDNQTIALKRSLSFLLILCQSKNVFQQFTYIFLKICPFMFPNYHCRYLLCLTVCNDLIIVICHYCLKKANNFWKHANTFKHGSNTNYININIFLVYIIFQYIPFQILYTKQTKKKHKVWHDGTLKFTSTNKACCHLLYILL